MHKHTLRRLYPILSVLAIGLLPSSTFGQGCMATRVSPPMLGLNSTSRYLGEGHMEASLAFRHYSAERHFYDTNNEIVPANAPRVKRTTLDASLTRMFTARTSATLSIPFQRGKFDRSPIPPFDGSADEASGIGDIALTFRRWMFEPENHTRYNLRLGAGLKFPTGDYDQRTDRLVNIAPPGSPRELAWRRGPADVAIQPGDGGWGFIMGAEGFFQIAESSLVYGEITYIANPRGDNGVNNQWSGAGPYVPNTTTSVPDYFLARAGLAIGEPLGWRGGSVQLGLRIEGQPVHDLFGGDGGFRRPGYTLAFEPGLAHSFGKSSVFVSVPLTVYRQRWRSVDEQRAGRPRAVSAAFADYNILAGYSHRW